MHHPTPHWPYQTAIFGDRHKLLRLQQAALRMLPADERLGADDGTTGQVNFWLVMQYQFVPQQRQTQVSLNRLPLDGAGVHILLEKLEIIASAFFGVIHRRVSALQ